MYLVFIHICGAFCRCCCVLMVAGQECQLKCRKPYSGLGVPRRIPWIRDVSPDVTMFWGLCHVSWWQHGSHTGKNECWRSCQDTTSCQNNWNNTHTHTTLLVANHTRNAWNFAELQHETVRLTLWLLCIRNFCVNSMDDFVQEVILPQGSFLDCNCWGHLRRDWDENGDKLRTKITICTHKLPPWGPAPAQEFIPPGYTLDASNDWVKV